jgi:signal transduction histidine kinase
MGSGSISNFKKGLQFVRNNPSLLYTVFLIIIIPFAFVLTGEMFKQVATSSQNLLERESVVMMQDVFAEFAPLHIDNVPLLQERILSITDYDPDITNFRIVVKEGNMFRVVASKNANEVGQPFDNPIEIQQYQFALGTPENVLLYPTALEGRRHWSSVRALQTGVDGPQGVVHIDLSVDHIDKVIGQKIMTASYILFAVILLVVILLLRHARVIDYAALYQRLKEVDHMKDDFISMAAHELRTPLTIIRGYTELLEDSGGLTDDHRKLTKNISMSAEHLAGLINDILDVARIQQGRMSMNLARTEIAPILESVVSSLEYTASQKSLKLILASLPEHMPTINIDPDRLKQVLINLVGNSVKYTMQGQVLVSVELGEEAETLSVRVSDTGIGISAEDQRKLFTRFYRIRSRETEGVRGTGLGLWITREIVQQMNGTITVESIKGKGSDFIVTFPTK